MKMPYKFLNKKKIKEIISLIEKQFGCTPNLDNYAFLISDKEKIYIVNKNIEKIPFDNLRINSIGIYFCEVKNNEIRFSIEGSQMIGKYAKINVIDINSDQAKEWLSGKNLDTDQEDIKGFVIIKSGKDFLGCGKIKNNEIMNYVPKIRRMHTVI